AVTGGSCLRARATGALRGRAQGFAYLGRRLHQAFRRLTDRLRVFCRESLFRLGDCLLDLPLDVGGDLSFGLLQGFLGAIDRRVGLIAGFDELLAASVFFGVSFGLLDHLLDVGLGQAAGCLNPDALLLAGGLVLGRYVDDAVGVDIEGDLDLRDAPRRRWDSDQIELGEELVVGRHLALALEDTDGDGGLIILRRRENLALLGWNGGVA